ncbi:MAG TPA: hypothetical protein VGZ25_13230, partial [Gemmataceae bacterium]|nr:hypothetical protein [Gemmataceae bacterium]
TFQAAYASNRESANDVALEAAIIAQPLLDLLEAQGQWSGKASDLLAALEGSVTDQVKREKAWPKNPRSLSGHLKRLSPNLRTMGWILEKDRNSKKRSWMIYRVGDANGFASSQSMFASSASTFASRNDECKAMQSETDSCEAEPNGNPYDAHDANDAKLGDVWNRDRY